MSFGSKGAGGGGVFGNGRQFGGTGSTANGFGHLAGIFVRGSGSTAADAFGQLAGRFGGGAGSTAM